MKYRYWCNNCQEYVLFSKGEKEWICDSCGNSATSYSLSNVPKEKFQSQWIKYKKYIQTLAANRFARISKNESLIQPILIIEDDACFEQMRKMFKDVKNNERCPCGSGKKYKRCCMGWDL